MAARSLWSVQLIQRHRGSYMLKLIMLLIFSRWCVIWHATRKTRSKCFVPHPVRITLSHIHFPEFEIIIDHFHKPFASFWILESWCQCSQLQLQQRLVAQQAVQLLKQCRIAVQFQQAGVSEDIILHPKTLHGPCFYATIATRRLYGAHVLSVPRREVVT